MKKWIFVIGVFVSLVSWSGCSYTHGKSSAEILEYMNNKYGVEFTYSSAFGNSLSDTRQILCNGGGYIGVLAQGSMDGIYKDNYLSYVYADDVRDYIQECCDTVFGQGMATGYFEIDNLAYESFADWGFEEFLGNSSMKCNFEVEIYRDFTDDEALEFAELLGQYGTEFSLTLVKFEDIIGDYDLIMEKLSDWDFEVNARVVSYDGKYELSYLEN